MLEFVTGEAIKLKIREVLAAGAPASLAVAYWGKGASTLLSLPPKLDHLTIICDLDSGFCNPAEMTSLLQRGATIWTRDNFHGKVYMSGARAVIGSANASSNGLGKEGAKVDLGLEAAVYTDHGPTIAACRDWLAIQLNGATRVDQERIQKSKPVWVARQKESLTGKSFLEVLDSDPEGLKKLSVRLLVYEDAPLTKPQKAMYEKLGPKLYGPMFKKYAARGEYPFYIDEGGDWKVSPGDFFVDYTVDSKSKKLSFNGVWQAFPNTPEWQVPIRAGGKGTVTFLREHVGVIGGLRFPAKEQNILQHRIAAFLKSHPLKSFDDETIDLPVHTAKWLRSSGAGK